METQLIFTIALAAFQFLLLLVVTLIGFIHKTSIANLTKIIEKMEIRMIKENDEIFKRLKDLEMDYADRKEVARMIDDKYHKDNHSD